MISYPHMSNKNTISLQKVILETLQSKKAIEWKNLVELLEKITKQESRKVNIRYTLKRTLAQMITHQEVLSHETEQGIFFRITPTGRQKLRSLQLSQNTHIMPLGWDGKWRMILLDIPEQEKEKRHALRYILKKAGFVCLKNSVWISPHPFEHMLENMKQDLGLADEIAIIVTDSVDPISEQSFRNAFWK